MKIFNLNADEWDRTEEREGWRFKDAWVGAHTDAELIGASMYEVEPGNKQGPFHTHHANEEWAIVLRGEPTLRTHKGEQQLRQGDVVAFPRGKEGAHQIRNDTDAPVRVLMLSTLIAPDIVEYLDTGKIGARSIAGERIIFARPGPELEYWEDRSLDLRVRLAIAPIGRSRRTATSHSGQTRALRRCADVSPQPSAAASPEPAPDATSHGGGPCSDSSRRGGLLERRRRAE